MYKKRKRVFPLPEAIQRADAPEGKWKIDEHPQGGGGVSLVKKQLHIPSGTGDYDRFIRSHELAHIAFSPPDPEEVQTKELGIFVGALEDIRVQFLMNKWGIDTSLVAPDILEQGVRVNPMAPVVITLMALLSTMNTGTWDEIMRFTEESNHSLYSTLNKLGKLISQRMAETDYTFDGVMKIAEELAAMFEAEEKAAKAILMPSMAEGGGDEEEEDGPYGGLDKRLDGIGELVRKLMGSRSKVPWGKMEILDFPRSIRHTGAMRKKMRRAMDEGVFLKHPHRWCSDKRVFGAKRKVEGGTVVIDASGSMRLDREEVDRLLTFAPECMIAVYSANQAGGTLRIIAKGGKRTDKIPLKGFGAGNVIDGPVLEWLNKQKHPRIWVCDGGVTGLNDVSASANTLECLNLCVEGKVFMAPNAEKGAVLLQNLAKGRVVSPESTLEPIRVRV